MAKSDSPGFIPNSFQTPNAHVDRLMHLLTPEEYKVLNFATRRILGFHKRKDRISLGQLVSGTVFSDAGRVDHGTGLSKATVSTALGNLVRFRILIRTAENDIHANEGAEYELQMDAERVDWDGLYQRKTERAAREQMRAANARNGIAPPESDPDNFDPTRSMGQDRSGSLPGLSHRTPPTRSMGQDTPGLSHRTPPVYGIDTQKTRENQGNPDSAAAATMRAHAHEAAPRDRTRKGSPLPKMDALRRAAAELYTEQPQVIAAVYAFLGGDLVGEPFEKWKDELESHLRHGREITPEILIAATQRASDDYARKRERGMRNVNWIFIALRELLNPPPASNEKDSKNDVRRNGKPSGRKNEGADFANRAAEAAQRFRDRGVR